MKKSTVLISVWVWVLTLIPFIAQAQGDESELVDASLFEARLKPFYHGVASGDPLQDRVIIWTRVTPDTAQDSIPVSWFVATDVDLNNIVASGAFTTNADRDYTVKVDVAGLSPNTTYYYVFSALGRSSLIGRTKTAPEADEANQLRFAVVSCSNYEAGYFNAYARIADRNDIDAVLHMGDYFYEYSVNQYGDTSLAERRHQNFEAQELDQYRARYSLYRLDKDLRRLHQQLPMMAVWDDHESANDAWKDGAENHQPDTEGDWERRKAESRRAHFEWIPIRENPDSTIYRKFNYGNMADILMLDTRIVGRDKQPGSILDSTFLDSTRSILGTEQFNWLLDNLGSSIAKWKVVASQVMFSEFHAGWGGPLQGLSFEEAENTFLDIWDGYPIERLKIINYIRDNEIDNTVIVSGDFHSSFAYDVADTVVNPQDDYSLVPNYTPETGEGAVAVEFTTPSITAANFDENIGKQNSDALEGIINTGEPILLRINNPNPHMKWVDLDRHGYLILDLQREQAQGNFYHVDRIDEPSDGEEFGAGLAALDGVSHLEQVEVESPSKDLAAIPAPLDPPAVAVNTEDDLDNLMIIGVYPNPTHQYATLLYMLDRTQEVKIQIFDLQGTRLRTLADEVQGAGTYKMEISRDQLSSGMYLLQFQAGSQLYTRKFLFK